MRERTLERYFVKETKRRGGMALKLVLVSLVGFPDRTVIGPGPAIGFAELKTSTGRVSKPQQKWIDLLRRFGFRVAVIRTKDETTTFLDEVLK